MQVLKSLKVQIGRLLFKPELKVQHDERANQHETVGINDGNITENNTINEPHDNRDRSKCKHQQ